MSGAEVLAAIGILCNAMQIVTFGRDALQVFRQMRDDGVPDPKLEKYLDDATASYQEITKQVSTIGPLNHNQNQIINIAEQAHKELQQFRREFEKVFISKTLQSGFQGKIRVFRKMVRNVWHARDPANVERNFQRHEQLLQTRLIHLVYRQDEANKRLLEQSSRDLRDLDATFKHIISLLAEGQTDLSNRTTKHANETMAHITKQHRETRCAIGEHFSETAQNLQSIISQPASQILEGIASLRREVDWKKCCEQVLASLRYDEMNSRKNQISTNYPETFHWIFNTDALSIRSKLILPSILDEIEHDIDRFPAEKAPFVAWLESEKKSFWISGKPGSGKSTLMKFIASSSLTKEHLTKWHSNVRVLTHYFWKAGVEMQQNVKGMLLSLLHQALLNSDDLTAQMWEELPFVRHKWSHSDWDLEELQHTLYWVFQSAGNEFCIFLDGLDESAEFERMLWPTKQNVTVLDHLAKLEKVKICVSSREEVTFCRYFSGASRLRIHQLTEYDIQLFAESRLKILSLDPGCRLRLLGSVVGRAEGVFLWVALAVDNITRVLRISRDIDFLMKCVEKTPTNLADLFREMWDRSSDDDQLPGFCAAASRYFRLAIAANRQIGGNFSSLLGIAIASEGKIYDSMFDASYNAMEKELHDKCLIAETEIPVVCRGLLELVHEPLVSPGVVGPPLEKYYNTRVQFMHRSAIDFFTDTELGKDILGNCGWSDDDSISRLLSSFLIISHYFDDHPQLSNTLITGHLLGNPRQDKFIQTTEATRYICHRHNISHFTFQVLSALRGLVSRGEARRNFVIEISRKWQRAGVFLYSDHWSYPGYSSFTIDPSELEYLEVATYWGNSEYPFKTFLEMTICSFLDAIPVFIRGLSMTSRLCGNPEWIVEANRFIKPILSRLLRLDQDTKTESMAKIKEAKKCVVRQLYSWYIIRLPTWLEHLRLHHCIGQGEEVCAEAAEVLHLFVTALSDTDWDLSMPLYLNEGEGCWFYVHSTAGWRLRGFWSAFLVVNFATAYRILVGMFTELGPEPEVLRSVRSVFKPILIREENVFYTPSPEKQSEVGALLQRSMEPKPEISRSELSAMVSCGHAIAHNSDDALRYLIGMLDHIDGLPMHVWTSGWTIQDLRQRVRKD